VSVYASHPCWTGTTIPIRLCIHSLCTRWQIPAEVDWLSGLRASPTVAQPPGTLFLLISTTLQTLIRSENGSRVYFLIVLTTDCCWRSWTCRIAAPYKFYVDWLIASRHCFRQCEWCGWPSTCRGLDRRSGRVPCRHRPTECCQWSAVLGGGVDEMERGVTCFRRRICFFLILRCWETRTEIFRLTEFRVPVLWLANGQPARFVTIGLGYYQTTCNTG